MENTVIESTDADGLNFNGNATNCTVKNNFIRNTGDDGLAIWSYPAADSGITFANNTIVQPTLANGIADYGGSNNTISNNVIADTERARQRHRHLQRAVPLPVHAAVRHDHRVRQLPDQDRRR